MIEQARNINEGNRIAGVLDGRRDAMSETVTDRQYAAFPELAAKYGPRGRVKCLQDAKFHFSYLSDAVASASPSLFSDYIGWAKVMLAARRVPAEDLSRNIEIMRSVVEENLEPDDFQIVDQYFDAGLRSLPTLPDEIPSVIAEENPLGEVAANFLDLLLKGDRRSASMLITREVEAGTEVRDIYLHVFQPSQREIGRLWQMNRISVAQEHFCTAATQLIMAQLYPLIFRTERNGRRIVATSIGGELHEIGVRIIADFFEMDGWDTYYLGANSPIPAVLESLTERSADLLAVSATMTFHVRKVADLIAAVRSSGELSNVKVLVGGYPFNVDAGLWQRVGADAFAPGAAEAVAVAATL